MVDNEKKLEHHESNSREHESVTGVQITKSEDSAIKQRQELLDASKAFRFTKGDNAFTIDLGDGKNVQDRRPQLIATTDEGRSSISDVPIPLVQNSSQANAEAPVGALKRDLKGGVEQTDTVQESAPVNNIEDWGKRFNAFVHSRFAAMSLDGSCVHIEGIPKGYPGTVVELKGPGQDSTLITAPDGHVIGRNPFARPIDIKLPEELVPMTPGQVVNIEGKLVDDKTHQEIPYQISVTRDAGGGIIATGIYQNERGETVQVNLTGHNGKLPFDTGDRKDNSDSNSGF
jgi:hypothetical protein